MINEIRIFNSAGDLKQVITCEEVPRESEIKLHKMMGRVVRKGVNLSRITETKESEI